MKLRSSIMGLVALTAMGALGGCAGSTVTVWGKVCHYSAGGGKTCVSGGGSLKRDTVGLSQPSNALGISQSVLNSPYGTAAKLTANVGVIAPTFARVEMVKYFDPSELTAQVAVQGGHLAGATGIARLQVLNVAGKVLATQDATYAIAGNVLYLQNPDALKSWLSTHGSALVKEGASGILVAANLPLIRNPNAPSVYVKTTINYNGTSIGSTTGNFRGLRGLHHGCGIAGVHCKVQ